MGFRVMNGSTQGDGPTPSAVGNVIHLFWGSAVLYLLSLFSMLSPNGERDSKDESN